MKLGKFKPAYKGQMELYLRWLEKYEKEPGEKTPLCLILCAGKASEQIELLELDKSGMNLAASAGLFLTGFTRFLFILTILFILSEKWKFLYY